VLTRIMNGEIGLANINDEPYYIEQEAVISWKINTQPIGEVW
jgi:hypothetical protein